MKHRAHRNSKLFVEAEAMAANPPLFRTATLLKGPAFRCSGLLVSAVSRSSLNGTAEKGWGGKEEQ